MKNFISFALLIFSSELFAAKALIYSGPGACEEQCAEASFEMARLAGLEPVYVDPENLNAESFKDAVIWIQPGGYASVAARALGNEGMDLIRNFVKDGGGYVGFCAGGFLATNIIGTTRNKGLGIVEGKSAPYKAYRRRGITLENTKWLSPAGEQERQIYWEGGAYFKLPRTQTVEAMAWYQRTGQIASVKTHFGAGKVYVTGLHPEAPQSWRDDVKLDDQDGLDYDLAVEMIHWVLNK